MGFKSVQPKQNLQHRPQPQARWPASSCLLASRRRNRGAPCGRGRMRPAPRSALLAVILSVTPFACEGNHPVAVLAHPPRRMPAPVPPSDPEQSPYACAYGAASGVSPLDEEGRSWQLHSLGRAARRRDIPTLGQQAGRDAQQAGGLTSAPQRQTCDVGMGSRAVPLDCTESVHCNCPRCLAAACRRRRSAGSRGPVR